MTHSIIIQISMAVLCLAIVGLHAAKKNANEVALYALQSAAIVALLLNSFSHEKSWSLLVVAVLTLTVKVVLAPLFLLRLIRKHKLKFAANAYTNVPGAWAMLVLLLLLANAHVLSPLTNIVAGNHGYLVLSLAMLFASIFLMVNRRGALSQVIGVLSLENSIVAFGSFVGLEQSAALQAGIVFDVFVWSIIAVVMVSMVYRHTGSLDVTNMKDLKD